MRNQQVITELQQENERMRLMLQTSEADCELAVKAPRKLQAQWLCRLWNRLTIFNPIDTSVDDLLKVVDRLGLLDKSSPDTQSDGCNRND